MYYQCLMVFLQQSSYASLIKFLHLACLGSGAFRKDESRPILLFHVVGQFQYLSDRLFRVFTVYIGCSTMFEVERNARNSGSSKLYFGDEFSVKAAQIINHSRNIVGTLMVCYKN